MFYGKTIEYDLYRRIRIKADNAIGIIVDISPDGLRYIVERDDEYKTGYFNEDVCEYYFDELEKISE